MIRLVATDLDGTLRGPQMEVPELHAQAIEGLRRRGITVLVATARRLRVVGPCLQQAGLVLPAVLLDGAIGIDLRTGHCFHQAVFAPADAVTALSSFRSSGLEPCVYVDDPDVDVIVSDTPSTSAAHLAWLGGSVGVENLDGVVSARPVFAFSVLGVPRRQLERAADLILSSGAEAVLYPEARFGGFGLIVNPPGITKWTGVEAFCRFAGIAADEVLAVGDGENDLPMLTQAAVAVAVKGGSERALAVADHVINPPNEHGWASLLDLV